MKSPPQSMIAKVHNLDHYIARQLANEAVIIARRNAPKLSGASAKRFTPYWGDGFYGIKWQDNFVWFQEQGIKPFTMKNLHGTIPLWISDPTGTERTKNPKAKTRVTKSGVTQILIFRRVGNKGAQKSVLRNGIRQFIPNTNYPGAPGRISLREAGQPLTATGKVGGQISPGNVGVRWRHPGITARHFLAHGISEAASNRGITINQLVAIGPGGEQSVSF